MLEVEKPKRSPSVAALPTAVPALSADIQVNP
jgi:hypothetical protein